MLDSAVDAAGGRDAPVAPVHCAVYVGSPRLARRPPVPSIVSFPGSAFIIVLMPGSAILRAAASANRCAGAYPIECSADVHGVSSMTVQSETCADTPCVFIIDDNAEVRRSLERLMRSAGLAAETFASAQVFLERAPYAGTGCVILDVRMPGMSGTALHEQLARLGIDLPVVYLTGYGDVRTGVKAMKDGAVDFLLKPFEDEVMLATVSQALARHATQRERERERSRRGALLARLSAREREVMECVIAGRLNKQIAFDLGISEKTVKAHRGRVMEKAEVRSVAELVRLCETVGIQPRATGGNSDSIPETSA